VAGLNVVAIPVLLPAFHLDGVLNGANRDFGVLGMDSF